MLISCTVLCECVCQCMMMTFDAADYCTVVAAILSIGLHATIVACLLREHGLGNSMSQLHKKLCESSTWRTRFDRQSSISASVSSCATHLSQLRCRSTSHPLVLPKSQWLSPYMSGTSSVVSMTSRLGSPVCSAPFSRWTPQKRFALLAVYRHSHSCTCTLMQSINYVCKHTLYTIAHNNLPLDVSYQLSVNVSVTQTEN